MSGDDQAKQKRFCVEADGTIRVPHGGHLAGGKRGSVAHCRRQCSGTRERPTIAADLSVGGAAIGSVGARAWRVGAATLDPWGQDWHPRLSAISPV